MGIRDKIIKAHVHRILKRMGIAIYIASITIIAIVILLLIR